MLETATINKSNKSPNRKEKQEQLYIDTAEAEHIEMYLKAIWSISESKKLKLALSLNYLM